jgi:hypothetical protein
MADNQKERKRHMHMLKEALEKEIHGKSSLEFLKSSQTAFVVNTTSSVPVSSSCSSSN